MKSKVAWFGFAVSLIVTLASAGAAFGQSAVGVWDLQGTGRIRVAGRMDSFPAAATLTLNGDRTYTLDTGDPVVETGAWFQDNNRVLLFASNILDFVVFAEGELSTELAEPVELVPIRSTGRIVINPRTGLLSVTVAQTFKMHLLSSGRTFSLQISSRQTGTRVP